MNSGAAIRDRFLSALDAEQRASFREHPRLEAVLQKIVDEATRSSSNLFDAREFVAHLASCVSDASALDEIHVDDLAVAFGCARGDAQALRVLESRFIPALRHLFARWRLPSTTEDEFVQTMREHLLVGDPPKIAGYRGRGRLASWMRMSGARMLTDISRRRTGTVSGEGPEALLAALTPVGDPGDDFLKARYRPEVSAAIAQALRALEPAARTLLRQRFIHGLALQELATLHGVHRVTISKRLAKARSDVMNALRGELAARLGTTRLDVDTIIRLCSSRLDLSLEEALPVAD